MGAMLASPVELIQVQRHGNAFYRAAVADMQGWRHTHEDGHAINSDAGAGSFWVLDGHGGSGCARYCSPKLGEDFVKGPYPIEDERIESGLSKVDSAFHEYVQENTDQESGSTVTGCTTKRQDDGTYSVKLINCGDSRGLLVMGPDASESCAPFEVRLPQHLLALGSKTLASPAGAGEPDYEEPNKGANTKFTCRWPLIAETVDHKPNHPTEKARIEAAGGFVSNCTPARLDGNLAVSRCLGDFEYKGDAGRPVSEQKCSCVPDIYEVNNVPAGSFVVLACDGLWDVCTGEYIATYIRDQLRKDPKVDLGEIATELIKYSLSLHSKDNVTLMIVQFGDGSEWASIPDEMKGFEKLEAQENESEALDEDIRRQYVTFLNRCAFPEKPVPCGRCKKWLRDMWQCPCKNVFYCCRPCQKKGWMTHKLVCPMLTGSACEEPEAERSPECQ